jgi:hypothetical protein
MEFTEQPKDLAALHPQFGAAHLFIDDCADRTLDCWTSCNSGSVGSLGNQGFCWSWSDFACEPCDGGWDGSRAACDAQFPACNNACSTGCNQP